MLPRDSSLRLQPRRWQPRRFLLPSRLPYPLPRRLPRLWRGVVGRLLVPIGPIYQGLRYYLQVMKVVGKLHNKPPNKEAALVAF